jgi:hypothetical protein
MHAPQAPVQNLFGVYTAYGHAEPDQPSQAPRWQAILASWLMVKSFKR